MLKQHNAIVKSVDSALKIASLCWFFLCAKFQSGQAQQLSVALQWDWIIWKNIVDSVSLTNFIHQSKDTLWFDTYDRAKKQNIPLRYVWWQVSHTYFRYYIREILNKDDQIIKLFEKTYWWQGDLARQYRYSLIFAKILDVYRSEKHRQYSFGITYLPTKQFFESIVATYSYEDLKKFATKQWIDRSEVEDRLGKIDYGKTEFSTENITKYGLEFVPRNVVYDYCINNNIGIRSSLLWDKENGESMHRYRTWLELRKESFDKLQKFTSLIQQEFWIEKRMIIISWWKDAWHGKDHAISHKKETFWKPLYKDDKYLYYQSHETGNCIDWALRWVDGLRLLDRLISHSVNKKERALNKKMYFSYKWCEFPWMCHGDIPMWVHTHYWLNGNE